MASKITDLNRIVRSYVAHTRHSAFEFIKPIITSIYTPTIVVFGSIMIVTVWMALTATDTVRSNAGVATRAEIKSIKNAIDVRLSTYEQSLRGGVGLFRAEESISRNDWRVYIESFNIDERYPGIEAIGYAPVIDDVRAFEQNVRETEVDPFRVTPQSNNDIFTPILYIEPQNERTIGALGYDMYSEPIRREAMETARDTGMTSISDQVLFVRQEDGRDQYGFLMYLPYYDEEFRPATVQERQAMLAGYVYAAFNADDLFNAVFTDQTNAPLQFQIETDGASPSAALFTTAAYSDDSPLFHTENLSLYGRDWTMRFTVDQGKLIGTQQLVTPLYILIGGTITALLITIIVFLLLKSRNEQLVRLRDRDVEIAKDELLSLASHQLRTPATGVKQYLGMVLQGFSGEITDQQRLFLEKAYSSNDRQLHVINEVLHLAKLDAGRIILARHETDLTSLLRDVVSEQYAEIKQNNHTLIRNIPSSPVYATIDSHMMRMSIENLITNAIKYTPPHGRITVTLKATNEDIAIHVKDTGVGIASEDQAKLFRQFSRITNPMSKGVSGTGIGLYLAKHLVELHGGTIDIASSPGKGSTFSIHLPR